MNEILHIKMLGGFSMTYGGKELVLDRNVTSKTTQLLQLLLLHKKTGIAKASLIEALYQREEVENRNGSLNNTIFRLRRQLQGSGLQDAQYITITGGMCYWTEQIPTEVDCLNFEALVERGNQKKNLGEKMKLYAEAAGIYEGEFLPDMIGEEWVAVQNAKDSRIYNKCMKELLEYCRKKEMYEEMICFSEKAEEIYPFEDWQVYHIDALIAMGQFEEAMAVYEKTEKIFFEELGISPSQEILKRFHYMGEHMSQAECALEDIKKRLREKEKMPGAYYCNYPSFVDIYHIVSRMMERNGISVFIMLCSIKGKNDVFFGTDEKERHISSMLQEAIGNTLRRGDFYTRYNFGQYLIILSGIALENCKKVSDRIDQRFQKCIKDKTYSVNYYVASVAEMCEDIIPEKKSVRRRNS